MLAANFNLLLTYSIFYEISTTLIEITQIIQCITYSSPDTIKQWYSFAFNFLIVSISCTGGLYCLLLHKLVPVN